MFHGTECRGDVEGYDKQCPVEPSGCFPYRLRYKVRDIARGEIWGETIGASLSDSYGELSRYDGFTP